jgi:hypothetical protein
MFIRRWCLLLGLMAFVGSSPAAEFSGKVIGISDGDTITVLRDRSPVRIRLHGIDCPETGQDFGARAKSFTSELAFGNPSYGLLQLLIKYLSICFVIRQNSRIL